MTAPRYAAQLTPDPNHVREESKDEKDLERLRDMDGVETDEQNALAPLVAESTAGGTDRADESTGAAGQSGSTGRTAETFPGAAWAASAASARTSWRRRVVVAPSVISVPGPVVAIRNMSARSVVARSGVLAGSHRVQEGASVSGQRRHSRRRNGSGRLAGASRRRSGDLEEEKNEEDHPLAEQAVLALSDGVAAGAPHALAPAQSDDDSSSQDSSDSEDRFSSSHDLVMVGNPPEEIRRILASSNSTIVLLLLLLLHYIVTHIMGIACIVLGSAAVVGLDRRLRTHADAQVLNSRFVLIGVAVTAVVLVALSALALNNFPEGEGLLLGLILMAPKPERLSVTSVIRTTIVVDLWARLLSISVKAAVALVSVPASISSSGGGSSSGNAARLCVRGRFLSCGDLSHRCRGCLGGLRGRGGLEAGVRLRDSPLPRAEGSPAFNADNESSRRSRADSRDESRGDGGGTQFSGGAGRARRVWLSLLDRFCHGPYRFGRLATSGTYVGRDSRNGGERNGRNSGSSGVFLSQASRQRRMYAVVEMMSMFYRSLLPVPVWLEFYGKESDYFAAIYLVLKGMEVSFRTDRLVRAINYIRRGDVGGRQPTPDELEEGSSDCSICYDQMVRPLILPCKHLFCGSCVAEWLEREHTCPLCREVVPTSNPIPKAVRDGHTAITPQVL